MGKDVSMNELAQLTIPRYGQIQAPGKIPTGGLPRLQEGVSTLIVFVFVLAIAVSLILLIWGGILWITSQGDKTKLDSARKRITFAVLGLALTFFSFFIVNVIGFFFNLKLI